MESCAVKKEMTLAIAIGIAIYRRRTGMGLNQEELASLSGTKQENISRMETKTGISTSISMLERLAEALGTRPHILMREGEQVRDEANA